jgi:hypothetical protein
MPSVISVPNGIWTQAAITALNASLAQLSGALLLGLAEDTEVRRAQASRSSPAATVNSASSKSQVLKYNAAWIKKERCIVSQLIG